MKLIFLVLSFILTFSVKAEPQFNSDFDSGAYWTFPIKIYLSREGLSENEYKILQKSLFASIEHWELNAEKDLFDPRSEWPDKSNGIIFRLDPGFAQRPFNDTDMIIERFKLLDVVTVNGEPNPYLDAIIALNPEVFLSPSFLTKAYEEVMMKSFLFALGSIVGLGVNWDKRSIMYPQMRSDTTLDEQDIMAIKLIVQTSQEREEKYKKWKADQDKKTLENLILKSINFFR